MSDERRWMVRVCWDGEQCEDCDCVSNPCQGATGLVEVVSASLLDEARRENARLRGAIELHQAVEYSDMPGHVSSEFLAALAMVDARLYAALEADHDKGENP